MRSILLRPVSLVATVLVVSSACTGSVASPDPDAPVGAAGASGESLVTIPPVGPIDTSTTDPVGAPEPLPTTSSEVSAALIDTDGQLALVGADGAVSNAWFKFDTHPSPDGTVAVLTLGPEVGDIGPERPINWISLPEGELLAEGSMGSAQELTATSLDGTFAGFTSRAAPAPEHSIAGIRRTSTIEIMSRHDGLVFSLELDGNFVPEAFSRRIVDDIPSQVFLLEYFPADSPTFYRVRVLSTSTGEVSLPLNLRNKTQQVDERMAGFSRSQTVAEEHGLLFTLYRGTIDGTPDGEPYAFVHTLDFADGVWCLDVDPRLELDRMAGSLAVGGDRLYVASANGHVGSYPIPSISDPNLSPSMDWVVDAGPRLDSAPVVTADHEAAYVSDPQRPGMLARVSARGDVLPPTVMAGTAEAFAWDGGALHAVGPGWATFELGPRPTWLGEIAHLLVG